MLTEKKKKRLTGIAIILLAAAFMTLVTVFVGGRILKYRSDPEKFRDWVDSRGVAGRLAYIGMVIFQVFFALIPGEPFEIAAGYAFGAFEGTALCIAASTLGSILVFLLVRKFGMKLVELFFSREKISSLKFLRTNQKRDFLFFILFMVPGTPKDLLCYFAGLTNMKFTTWLFICSVGRLPAIVTSTVGGDALGEKNYWLAFAVFAVTAVVSAVGLVIYNYVCRKRGGYLEVTAAVISDGDRYLVCQRPADKKCGLLWEFPGGKLEPGETAAACVARECREELGVTLSVEREITDIVYKYPDRTIRLHFFLCTVAEGVPTPIEHNEIRFATADEISALELCPADAYAVKKRGLLKKANIKPLTR